jgi:hypothetical protein
MKLKFHEIQMILAEYKFYSMRCACFRPRKFDFSPEMSTAHTKKVDLRDKFTGPYCDIDYWPVIVGIKRRPKEE